MSEFSNRFRQLKEESSLTLKDLSEELGISVPNLSYYMKGREPSYDILISIANYFNVTTDWLIGNDTKQSTSEKEIINLRIENKKLLNKINEMKSQLINLVEKLQYIC